MKQLYMTSKCALMASALIVNLSSLLAQQPLSGFVPTRQADQYKIEADFKAKQSSTAFKHHLEKLSSVPHSTGLKENEQVRDYIAETMRKAGWQVDIYPHDVLLPRGPGEIAVELVEPIRQPFNIREFIFTQDKYASDPRLTDPDQAMGVSVKDKIVLARYGVASGLPAGRAVRLPTESKVDRR